MKDAFKYFMLSENCAAMISATWENTVPISLSKWSILLKAQHTSYKDQKVLFFCWYQSLW